ncbi:hypothetical protein VPNG_04726 [Cytospora leucostoma]|uniref:Uncharacterized protein n=1 Tax=Cytospora leucostoma TaxID=1230097 RepID=A0A423XAG5_9PEZI|nr:hypothetical protein VPNG_04726 [Cytospora leucostoma]
MPASHYEALDFWRDIAVAMYEHWSPSKTDLGQITAAVGWNVTASGLYFTHLPSTFTSLIHHTLISPKPSPRNKLHQHKLFKMSDRTIWDEKAHLDLLMAIMKKVTLTSDDWASILPELQAKGSV